MFTPENDLERSLVQAAGDPAHRPQFYKDLVVSNIWVVSAGPPVSERKQVTIPPGTTLQFQEIERDGKHYLPIFSSLPRLQAAIREEVSYLKVNAEEFLKMTRGAQVLLNPGSDYGKEFTVEEIAAVIDGTIGKPVQTYRSEQAEQVLIGQPKSYPYALVDALSRLFKTLKGVDSAYLVHFHNPAQNVPPHTLIGIVATGDWDDTLRQVGVVAQSVEIPDPPVDVIRVDAGNLTTYFASVKPFYKREVFGLF